MATDPNASQRKTSPAVAGGQDADLLGLLRRASTGTLDERMGIEVVEASGDRVVLRMPVEGNRQPYGLLHGGANAVLAESAGSIGAALSAGPGRIAVGIELSVSHHRAATSGWVTAVATPVSRGRTLAVYEIVVADELDGRTCTARLTCLMRDAPPG